jgi:hypothetical protein
MGALRQSGLAGVTLGEVAEAARPVIRWMLHATLTGALTVGLLVFVVGDVCVVSSSMMTRLQLNSVAQDMHRFAAQHEGRMPGTLDELASALPDAGLQRDQWGHPLLMLTTPDAVAVVSLGRDGVLGGVGEDADLLKVVTGRPDDEAVALIGAPAS